MELVLNNPLNRTGHGSRDLAYKTQLLAFHGEN